VTHTTEETKQAHQGSEEMKPTHHEAAKKLTLNIFEDVERDTEKSIYELLEQTLSERRIEVEEEYGSMTFTVNFPFIGRGNPLREKIISRAIIERRYERALKRLDKSITNRNIY